MKIILPVVPEVKHLQENRCTTMGSVYCFTTIVVEGFLFHHGVECFNGLVHFESVPRPMFRIDKCTCNESYPSAILVESNDDKIKL